MPQDQFDELKAACFKNKILSFAQFEEKQTQQRTKVMGKPKEDTNKEEENDGARNEKEGLAIDTQVHYLKQEMQELEEDSSIFSNAVELLPAFVNISVSNKYDTLESEEETNLDESFLKEKQKATEVDIRDLYVEELLALN